MGEVRLCGFSVAQSSLTLFLIASHFNWEPTLLLLMQTEQSKLHLPLTAETGHDKPLGLTFLG